MSRFFNSRNFLDELDFRTNRVKRDETLVYRDPPALSNTNQSAKYFKQMGVFDDVRYSDPSIRNMQEFRFHILENIDYMEKNHNKTAALVIIYFRNKDDENQITYRSLKIDKIDREIDFINEIDRIYVNTQNVTGSEVLISEYELDMTHYDMLFITPAVRQGNGSLTTLNYFKHDKSINDGFCGLECLIKCGVKITKEEYINKELKYLNNLIIFLEKYDDIQLMLDFIFYKGKREANYTYQKINETNYDYIIYKKSLKPKHFIIFNEKHYAYTNNLEAKYDMYVDNTCVINIKKNDKFVYIEDRQKIYKKLTDNKVIKQKCVEERYLFIDYETITDFEHYNVNKEYSVAYLDLSENDLNDIVKADNEKDQNYINNLILKQSNVFTGFDCSIKLLKYIENKQKQVKYHIITFNGANFDNYILYNAVLKNSNNNIGNCLMANGQMLEFKLFNTHKTFDLRKWVVGSLANLCKSFNVYFKKKGDFSHYEMQKKYENNELLVFIQDNELLIEYNTYDVVSLAVLFSKFKFNYEKIFKQNIMNYMTLGQSVNEVFKNHVKNKNIKLPMVSEKYYDDLQKNRVAGRVELFNGVQKVESRVYSLDVCSLYPYSMFVADNYFPTGNLIECDKYQDKPKHLIGYFYCDIDQTGVKHKIHPQKTDESNNWKADIINNVLISSVMIDYMRQIENLTVTTRNGFYYDGKIEGIELFKFLAEVMKLKNNQDVMKENKDANYNGALREVYKLVLNILSGKLNQGLNTEKREIVTIDEFNKLYNNKHKFRGLNAVCRISNDKTLVAYDTSPSYHNQKPIAIGTLIYDYSKIYMHRQMYSKIPFQGLIYTDTDSCKMTKKYFNIWLKYGSNNLVPHNPKILEFDNRYANHKLYETNSKVFGSFDEEYADFDNNLSYFLQPKFYMISNVKNNTFKFHAKGISENDIIINSRVKGFGITTDKDRSIIFNTYKNNSIKNNIFKFFKQLYKDKKISIITFSMLRSHSNQKQNTGFDQYDKMNQTPYSIITQYNIKQIQI